MYTEIANCRSCGKSDLEPVFSLGNQPLANDFCRPGEERQGLAPLEVLFCNNCGLAQLSVVVNPELLYGKTYPYITSQSVMMREHFARLWADCSKRANGKTVVEIGSNDGLFLSYCQANGAERVLGIEPAPNLVEIARRRGVETINDFFGLDSATMASLAMPKVSLIFARHVFCHVHDWMRFMRDVQILADKDTLICLEVPYVMDLLDNCQFDTIYHEHLSYLSIRAMRALLENGPFHMRHILHYPIHGGAIVLMLQRRGDNHPVDPSVSQYLQREVITRESWKLFGDNVRFSLAELRSYISSLTNSGKRIAGYGASAKSTVWINACDFKRGEILFVTDTTPEKQNRLVPGTRIPVVPASLLSTESIDYSVIFAWNYAAEILKNEERLMHSGLKFIVPGPHPRVIGMDS